MTANFPPETCEGSTVALKRFKCSRCGKEKACAVKLKGEIICVNCRYDDIGKDALYEALYNGLD